MKLTRELPATERDEFRELFKDRSFSAEYSMDGKIISVKTEDPEIISWLETKGLTVDTTQTNEYVEKTAEEVKDMILNSQDISKLNIRPETLLEALKLVDREVEE